MPRGENNGSWFEGLTTVLGGLMKMDTNGKVDHITKTVTNEKDGGVDYIRDVDDKFDYFKYVRDLKKERK